MYKVSNILHVINIVDGTTVDGPGFRTSIYFAGCTHHCPGCHNPSTWDPNAGHDMTIAELLNKIKENDFDVTFTGGDPIFQVEKITILAQEIKKMGKKIWLYTGYEWKDVWHYPMMKYVDVLVDGEYVAACRDVKLLWKGSSNQQVINVKETLKKTDPLIPVLHCGDYA